MTFVGAIFRKGYWLSVCCFKVLATHTDDLDKGI